MTDELIERFFNKQCTFLEAAEVSQYLKDNPAHLEVFLSTREWFSAGSCEMPPEFWNDSWSEIKARRATVKRITWIKRVAAAAVILIGSELAYKSLYIKQKPAPLASVEKIVEKSGRKITVNNSTQMMSIDLPDSSAVQLSPGSLITYNVPFDRDRREITLDGEARFRAMKDEHRPFTVFAGGLATTALGTEFTINTKNNVSVKLHNGKVMITATGDQVRFWKKNVVLEPGQQLNYNLAEKTAAVERIKTESVTGLAVSAKKHKNSVADVAVLNFVNASLPVVMNGLMAYYHQKINFDSNELEEMNFTGTISQNDSLKIVLKVIAQMNSLELSHDGDGYELKRN